MKRYQLSIIIPLLMSLFVYLFYRIDQTNINLILNTLFQNSFSELKTSINQMIQLPEFMIYNVPEGLWVFSISLLGAKLFIKIKKVRIHLIYLPISFALVLEIIQAMHITNGTFDPMDMLISSLGWLFAFCYYLYSANTVTHLPNKVSRLYIFCFVFCCVYLSDINNLFWITNF